MVMCEGWDLCKGSNRKRPVLASFCSHVRIFYKSGTGLHPLTLHTHSLSVSKEDMEKQRDQDLYRGGNSFDLGRVCQ